MQSITNIVFVTKYFIDIYILQNHKSLCYNCNLLFELVIVFVSISFYC